MPSALWGWIESLNGQIYALQQRNQTLQQECRELLNARGWLDSLLSAHDNVIRRQRSSVNACSFDSSRAAQMLRSHLLGLLDGASACTAKIDSSRSAAEAARTRRTTESDDNAREMARLAADAAAAQITAIEEDAREAAGNA